MNKSEAISTKKASSSWSIFSWIASLFSGRASTPELQEKSKTQIIPISENLFQRFDNTREKIATLDRQRENQNSSEANLSGRAVASPVMTQHAEIQAQRAEQKPADENPIAGSPGTDDSAVAAKFPEGSHTHHTAPQTKK